MGLFHKHKERAVLEDLSVALYVMQAWKRSNTCRSAAEKAEGTWHQLPWKNCTIDEVAPDAEILISHHNFAADTEVVSYCTLLQCTGFYERW